MRYGHLTFGELSITDKEFYISMGYHDQVPDQCILHYINEIKGDIQTLCKIRYMYAIHETKLLPHNILVIQDKAFSVGKIIASYLENVTHVCSFIVTAGKEYDAYIQRLRESEDIVKEFVADSIGSVIAEACVKKIGEQIQQIHPFNQTLPYSPGYCGWNIKEQKLFFELFPDDPVGVTLNTSYLMSPVKSISGIIGLGENLKPKPYHCELCTNKKCYKRRI